MKKFFLDYIEKKEFLSLKNKRIKDFDAGEEIYKKEEVAMEQFLKKRKKI